MRVLDIFTRSSASTLTRNQRLGHYLALGLAVVWLVVGLNLRSSILYETKAYFDPEAGIRVSYPASWLIDARTDEYVFRARDLSRVGYKTTFQISTVVISDDMTASNVFTDLSLFRSTRLADYRELARRSDFVLPDGERADLMEYTFVFRERNPFQESLGIIVVGRDVLVFRRGQGILVTFLADAQTYQTDLDIFQRILTSLNF